MYRKPVITAPAHSGIAIPRFIDNWVVGVNEWGKRPRRLVEPINIIREISIRDQVRPLGECIIIICFRINWANHCWAETSRLLISRVGAGNRRVGNIIIRITIGKPIIVGVIKEENRFSFILFLMGWGRK